MKEPHPYWRIIYGIGGVEVVEEAFRAQAWEQKGAGKASGSEIASLASRPIRCLVTPVATPEPR